MTFITPGSPEHMKLISPSKIPAILGISRWESKYALWMRMKGLADPKPPKDIFAVGHAFEPAIANLYHNDHPDWRLSRGEVQFVVPQDKYGFPVVCTLDRRASKGRARRVVEMKTARNMDEWGDDGSGDCPIDYASQVIAQMMFSGYHKNPAHLVVLSGYFKHYTYTVEYDPAVADWIIAACKDFYESLASDDRPPLDDSISTYEVVRNMHPDINGGERVEVPGSLIMQIRDHRSEQSRWESAARGGKTKLLDIMGNAEFATVNGVIVAQRTPHPTSNTALRINTRHFDE